MPSRRFTGLGPGAPSALPGAPRGRPAGVLALQQGAGNRAVARTLARKTATAPARPRTAPAAKKAAARSTGLLEPARIEAYTKAAVAFWRDVNHHDTPLKAYGEHLFEQANKALSGIGSRPVNTLVSMGKGGHAGAFHADLWLAEVNLPAFSERENVETVRDLDYHEAASVAGRVYHEARHSEQYFRMARTIAGRAGKRPVDEIADEISTTLIMDEDAAKAAAARPLKSAGVSAQAAEEVQGWEDITYGAHRKYRELTTDWLTPLKTAHALAENSTARTVERDKERLEGMIESWNRGGRVDFIAEHIRSTILRTMSVADVKVLGHLQALEGAVAQVNRSWAGLSAAWAKAPPARRIELVKGMAAPLKALSRAAYSAYGDQAVEADAWEAGNAVHFRFLELAAKPSSG